MAAPDRPGIQTLIEQLERAGGGKRSARAAGRRQEARRFERAPVGARGHHRGRAGYPGVKPRRVKKLDPHSPLADNAARIIRTRLDEMLSFAPVALEFERSRTSTTCASPPSGFATSSRRPSSASASPRRRRGGAPATCRTCSASCTTATSCCHVSRAIWRRCGRRTRRRCGNEAGDSADIDPGLAALAGIGPPTAAWKCSRSTSRPDVGCSSTGSSSSGRSRSAPVPGRAWSGRSARTCGPPRSGASGPSGRGGSAGTSRPTKPAEG